MQRTEDYTFLVWSTAFLNARQEILILILSSWRKWSRTWTHPNYSFFNVHTPLTSHQPTQQIPFDSKQIHSNTSIIVITVYCRKDTSIVTLRSNSKVCLPCHFAFKSKLHVFVRVYSFHIIMLELTRILPVKVREVERVHEAGKKRFSFPMWRTTWRCVSCCECVPVCRATLLIFSELPERFHMVSPTYTSCLNTSNETAFFAFSFPQIAIIPALLKTAYNLWKLSKYKFSWIRITLKVIILYILNRCDCNVTLTLV